MISSPVMSSPFLSAAPPKKYKTKIKYVKISNLGPEKCCKNALNSMFN